MGGADARIHVQHHRLRRAAGIDGVDPSSRQVGQRRQVGLAGQGCGLEPPHLAGGGGLFAHGPLADDPAHGGGVAEVIGIVHVLVSGQPSEHGLPELGKQGVAAVASRSDIGHRLPGHRGQAESLVESAEGQQPGVGGDARAVELQLQLAVEFNSKVIFRRFTRRISHPRPPQPASLH